MKLSLLRVLSDKSQISLTGAHDPILGQSGQLHLEAGPKSLMIEANIAGQRPRQRTGLDVVDNTIAVRPRDAVVACGRFGDFVTTGRCVLRRIAVSAVWLGWVVFATVAFFVLPSFFFFSSLFIVMFCFGFAVAWVVAVAVLAVFVTSTGACKKDEKNLSS